MKEDDIKGIKMFLGLSKDVWVILGPIVVAVIGLIGIVIKVKFKEEKEVKKKKNSGNISVTGDNNSIGSVSVQGSNNTIGNNNSL